MKVTGYTAYRIVKDINISVGDIIQHKSANKVKMEALLENVRRQSYPNLPSRQIALYVFNSIDDENTWMRRIGVNNSGYYLLKLSLTGDLFWLNSDLLHPNMSISEAETYWSSNFENISSNDFDFLPEGLFIGEAKVTDVYYKTFHF